MGLAITIAITGVEKVIRDFKRKQIIANSLLEKAIKTGALAVVGDAIKIAPEETSYLRDNITYELTGKKGKPSARVGVNDIVDYAEAVEFMTYAGKQPRKPGKKAPFLYPSLQKNQVFINGIIAEAIKRGMAL